MKPNEIRALLILKGVKVAVLARRQGVPRTMVHSVITGRLQTPRVRRAIAAELGVPYLRVWGVEDPGIDTLPRGPRGFATPVTRVA
jgi:lambda repressor-like predicted transcriptional regulator